LSLAAAMVLAALMLSIGFVLGVWVGRTQPAAVREVEGAKRRYEVLLPARHNDGRPVDPALVRQTCDELLERFGGFTHAPQPVQGAWRSDGRRFDDESTLLYVDVDDNADSRAFMKEFKARLARRFEQNDVYMTSYPIRHE
jgi:hypothetical protein